MKRILFRPEVHSEIREAQCYYERQRKGLGKEFRAEIKKAIARIQRMPTITAPVHRDIRASVADRFPYVIYYRVVDEGILITAVLHGSRDPDLWMGRD